MKECLVKRGYNIYNPKDCPASLADKALKVVYGKKIRLSDVPIDPFRALKKSGVEYRFYSFDDLDGIYLPPEDLSNPKSLAVVGLKYEAKMRLSRLRFTAAHEFCHHLKDERASISCQQEHNPEEKYANEFAIDFLMPNFLLEKALKKENITKDSLNFNDMNVVKKIFEISLKFEVSLQSTLIHVKNFFGIDRFVDFRKIISEFSPDKKIHDFKNSVSYELICWKQIINSGNYTILPSSTYKTDFLNCLICNDHRIEDGSLAPNEIKEQLAIIRRFDSNSEKIKTYIKENNLNNADMTILGEYDMYTSLVFKGISNFLSDIFHLNLTLFKYVPYPKAGGCIRKISASIAGKTVKLNDPNDISENLNKLVAMCSKTVSSFKSKGDALCDFAINHHEFTIIHPFMDGNGRTSRAFLNMQLESVGLPMIYVEEDEREAYQKALEYFDSTNNASKLFFFFCYFIVKKFLTFER